MVERRFNLLVSVGLTVLAPRPVAWDAEGGRPGIIDMRFPDDVGVVADRLFVRPGDLPANDEDRLCSGVMVGVEGCN
jgi:hypothetical protein